MEKPQEHLVVDGDMQFDDDGAPMDPSLKDLIAQTSLRWIFVGGKGGVGKTTTSCCLAIQLAKVRENVLIISTDPAHNLSDALCQKLSRTPCPVEGFSNLYAMEVETKVDSEQVSQGLGLDSSVLQDVTMSFPGIDEVMSFAEVLNIAKEQKFSVIVFDTAPTGHTLRFLAMPALVDKLLGKIIDLKSKFSPILSSVSSMMGMGGNGENGPSLDSALDKITEMKQQIEEASTQFKNPDLTTFVCVCIPEFLSVFETERLVQELAKVEIDAQNVVVNQIVFPDPDTTCKLCMTRSKMQKKYLEQIDNLYEDFHIVKMPLLDGEIRGVPALLEFGKNLLEPYKKE